MQVTLIGHAFFEGQLWTDLPFNEFIMLSNYKVDGTHCHREARDAQSDIGGEVG